MRSEKCDLVLTACTYICTTKSVCIHSWYYMCISVKSSLAKMGWTIKGRASSRLAYCQTSCSYIISISYQNTICTIQVTFCALVPSFSRGVAIYHERPHPLQYRPKFFVSFDTKAKIWPRVEVCVRVKYKVMTKDLQFKISLGL